MSKYSKKTFTEMIYDICSHFSNDRIKQPLYRTFMLSWVLVNWQLLYFIFFVDEKMFFLNDKKTKFEYLVENYSLTLSFTSENLIFLAKFLLVPSFLTWLFIWIFPQYIARPALSKHSENVNEDSNIHRAFEIERKRQENEFSDLEAQEVRVSISKDKNEIEYRQLNQDIWDSEYETFKNQKEYFAEFSDIINRINFSKGNMHFVYSGNRQIDYWVNKKTLSFMLSKGLLERKDDSVYLYILTLKGKYFSDKYINEGNLRDFDIPEEFLLENNEVVSAEDIPF